MTALAVYGSSVSPEIAVISGASQIAKSSADRSVRAGKDRILQAVKDGKIPEITGEDLRKLSIGGVAAGTALTD